MATETVIPPVETKPPVVTPPPITDQTVIDKVSKGETLSPEETEHFKSLPPGSIPNPTEKKEEAAAPPVVKKEETPGKVEIAEDRKQLIFAELQKPDALVDLSKFKSAVELGLYWDLKRAQRRNLTLADENLNLKVEQVVKKLQTEKVAEVKLTDPFEGKDEDDVLTVGEAREIFESLKPPVKKVEPPVTPLLTTEQVRLSKVEADQRLKSKGIDDFYDVVDFSQKALEGDEEARDILRETALDGGNVAEKTYWLIKGSKKWPEIETLLAQNKVRAEAGAPPVVPVKQPPADNLKREEKLNAGDLETKTTGPGSSGAPPKDEYTRAEVESMTSAQIRKLPKATRQAILDKFGSSPNYG